MELTAWEELRFIGLANREAHNSERRTGEILNKLELWEARDLILHHFSHRMRLKLGLVLVLIRRFEVLLLDEPTSALDEEGVGVWLRNYSICADKA